MKRNRTLIGLLPFLLAVAGLILLLVIINWIPQTVRKDTLREYASIEQVRASLNIRDIYIPSYFPQNITWPPVKILAQASPFPALVMSFTGAGKDEIVLVLSQSAGKAIRTAEQLELTDIREETPFVMRGNNATLTVGRCRDKQPCSRISWNEAGYLITVQMRSTPVELSRIAESMHP
jgi:hypothetical protein